MGAQPDFPRDIAALARVVLARVDALQSEIDDLQAEVIPQEATEKVLGEMACQLAGCRDSILVGTAHVTDQRDFDYQRLHYSTISTRIAHFVSLLGFLRRSAHERNPYEFYGPLVDLAHSFLRASPDVVLSSEWDYSPFARYSDIDVEGLSCVFVGLPVTEAGNPLVIPLAGHELGHTLWSHWRSDYEKVVDFRRYIAKFEGEKIKHAEQVRNLAAARQNEELLANGRYERIHRAVENSLEQNIRATRSRTSPKSPSKKISPAAPPVQVLHNTVINQVEEIFCDFAGIRMFGASYLYAFHYLVAPNLGEKYNHNYPSTSHRYRLMRTALRDMGGDAGLDLPEGDHWWQDIEPEDDQAAQDSYYGGLVLDDVAPLLLDLVEEWFKTIDLAIPTASHCAAAKARLDLAAPVPAAMGKSLPNIILAGWMAHRDDTAANGSSAQKIRVVNELVLKSIELLEIESLGRSTREMASTCC